MGCFWFIFVLEDRGGIKWKEFGYLNYGWRKVFGYLGIILFVVNLVIIEFLLC